MEIRKAKELRDKLQEDILSLVQKFEEETETHVHYVSLDSEQMLKNPLVQCYHGTCKTTQLKDFVAFSIILSEIEFLVRI